jgi:hypothetical protein
MLYFKHRRYIYILNVLAVFSSFRGVDSLSNCGSSLASRGLLVMKEEKGTITPVVVDRYKHRPSFTQVLACL